MFCVSMGTMGQFTTIILFNVCNYAFSTSNWRHYAGYQHTEPLTALQTDSKGTVFARSRHDIFQFSNNELNTSINPKVKLLSICNGSAKENDYTNTPVFIFQCFNNTNYLMTCCSYGPCFFHDISNISNFRMAKAPLNTTVPLISSKGSALAISGPCENDYGKIYSAVSPREDETTRTFSGLGLYTYNDDLYLKYLDHGRPFITSKENTDFEFIYGFSNKHDFTYFLRNTRRINGDMVAYISQTCNNDPYFMSYIESKIECKGFSVLEAATVFHLTPERQLLVCAFTGQEKHLGTKVCTYDVPRIHSHFEKLLNNCFYHLSGSAPAWIKMNDTSAQTTCKTKSNKKRITCGYTQENTRILGNVTLVTEDVLMTADETITSVVLDLFGDIVVGYFGSSNGTIRKVIFEKELKDKMELFLWTNAHQERIVDMKLNAERNRLYFIQGSTVGRIQIDNCTNHKDCQSCLEDVITCVWTADNNQNQGSCVNNGSAHGIFETFCPPIVTAITPMNGPSKGGTRLTVNGIFVLARSSSSKGIDPCCENGNLLQVMLGESPCTIVNVKDLPNSFVCETTANALKTEEDKVVNVTVLGKEPNNTMHLQKIHTFGSVTKLYRFSYKNPMLNSDQATSPVKLSGGIQISLHGENLHIGSRLEVFIGDVPCPVTQSDKVTSTTITCRAPAMQTVASYGTTVHIDNEILTGPNITYLPDPVLKEFSPISTIQSGGVTMTVHGENLSGYGETPNIVVTSIDHKNNLTISGSCITSQSQMRCTFGKYSTKKLPVNGIVDLYNVYGSLQWMIGNSTLYVRIKEDPVLFENATDDNVLNNGISITFSGKNLLNVDRTEIKLTIGPYPCLVTNVTENTVTCSVPDNIYSIQNDVRHEAKVNIGSNIHYSLGEVIFASRREKNLEGKQKVSLGLILGISIPGVLAFVLLVLCGKWLHKCMHKVKDDSYSVHYRRDNNFLVLDELSESHTSEMGQSRLNDYQDRTHYRPVLENSTEKDTADQLWQLDDDIYTILKEKELLIDSECLILGEIVGQGHFSCVYKGYLRVQNEKEEVIVAAKTLHRSNPKDLNVQMFLNEALIMKDFCHKNVMTLYGICFGIDQLPLVVLPFMKRGDLLSYIRDVNNVPTVKDLVVFGVDIANGMNYLSELKFVHRDLAARNCMIDDDMVVKVADFGLSRDVYEKEYYSSRDAKTKLPVKWMSPESLEFGMFNTKSDIWSFGIVLWELLTRGMNPYPTVDNWDMLRYLKDGRRLSKPDFCPEEMFRIMLQCWEWNPDKRPTFKELIVKIPDLLRRLQKASEKRRNNNSTAEEMNFNNLF